MYVVIPEIELISSTKTFEIKPSSSVSISRTMPHTHIVGKFGEH
jgi:hypothetical protein